MYSTATAHFSECCGFSLLSNFTSNVCGVHNKIFWKAQKHARVLSGLNLPTTTAINGSARGKKHFGHGQ